MCIKKTNNSIKPIRFTHLLAISALIFCFHNTCAADTAQNERIETSKQRTYVANNQWLPIEWSCDAPKPGSALDFSIFLDAPAGKYGDIINKNGHFSFLNAPEKSIRFYGTNLTHEVSYCTKEESERLAAKLAAEGFNAVRIHLYERWLTTSDGATAFIPAQKEKLDYLIHCLRKKGIYYVMTIYSGAYFSPGIINDIPEFQGKKFRFEFAGLAMISEDAMRYIRDFSKSLLCSINPFTGLAPKDDPALISIELTNENALNIVRRNYPEFVPIFRRECKKFLTELEGCEPSEKEIETYYNRFVIELHFRFYEKTKKYLRDELGIKKLLNDANCRSNLSFSLVRNAMDYVDVHSYWDLYRYIGSEYGGGSLSKGRAFNDYRLRYLDPLAGGWLSQLEAGVPRVFGKPFSCGEFNMCYPAPDRAFAAPLQSALAALQGWGMILHYGYAIRPEMALQTQPERRLQIATSPLSLYSERIGSAIFKQGDAQESQIKIPLIVTPEYLYGKLKKSESIAPPMNYSKLGFICQIGTLLIDKEKDLSPYSCVVIPEDMENIPDCVKTVKYFRSDTKLFDNIKGVLSASNWKSKQSTTGEILLDDKARIFSVTTGQSICVLMSEKTSEAQAGNISISENKTATTFFVKSLDGQPLDKSKRALLLYITDLKNTGTVVDYDNPEDWPIVRDQGELPYLVEQQSIAVSWNQRRGQFPTIWALSYEGERVREIPIEVNQTGFFFRLQAVTTSKAYWAYELTWK